MSKKENKDTQLTLNLTTNTAWKGAESGAVRNVVRDNVRTFVDAGTLAVRREAIKRVEKAGIFSLAQDRKGD